MNGRDSRKGAIKDRNKKYQTRIPDLGYYLIVTDTLKTTIHMLLEEINNKISR